jgi:hypothetical protein
MYIHTHVHIYIYIERERERENKVDLRKNYKHTVDVCMYDAANLVYDGTSLQCQLI